MIVEQERQPCQTKFTREVQWGCITTRIVQTALKEQRALSHVDMREQRREQIGSNKIASHGFLSSSSWDFADHRHGERQRWSTANLFAHLRRGCKCKRLTSATGWASLVTHLLLRPACDSSSSPPLEASQRLLKLLSTHTYIVLMNKKKLKYLFNRTSDWNRGPKRRV